MHKKELNKENNDRHVKMRGGDHPEGLNNAQKLQGVKKEINFLKEEHTNYLSNTKLSALKTYNQVKLYILSLVYIGK